MTHTYTFNTLIGKVINLSVTQWILNIKTFKRDIKEGGDTLDKKIQNFFK